jgi:uncharacterized protein GlcG (DUF336 family)
VNELTLENANRIIEAALAKARKMELPPLSVAVLDAGGHLKALQREDGQAFLRVRVCQAKAWGALALGTDSANIAERYEQGLRQQGFFGALNAMSGGRLIPLPGGVLIHNRSGDIIGAVGVAGAVSEEDEACAMAGIAAAGFGTSGD